MSFAAEFVAGLKRLDAERLQQSAKAAIQVNGRLSLTVEAGRLMHLADDKSIIIFAAANGDLGAIVSHKGDKQAFDLKKAGAYYYISFKNYLQEQGIDYKNQRIIYDITELEEKLEGRTVYRFARRVLPKEAKELPLTGDPSPYAEDDDDEETREEEIEREEGRGKREETSSGTPQSPATEAPAAEAPAETPTPDAASTQAGEPQSSASPCTADESAQQNTNSNENK